MHSAVTGSECPSRRAVSAPVPRSHSRIVLSSEPEARRPSGSTHSAAECCPGRVPFAGGPVSAPVLRSHSRIVLSSGARGQAAVGQHAQRGDRIGVPFEAGGLGAGVTSHSRIVLSCRARGEATVGQHAQRGDLDRMCPSRRAVSAPGGVKLKRCSRMAGGETWRRAASRKSAAPIALQFPSFGPRAVVSAGADRARRCRSSVAASAR